MIDFKPDSTLIDFEPDSGQVAVAEPNAYTGITEPEEAGKRAKEVWDKATDWQTPLYDIADNYDYIHNLEVTDPATSGMDTGPGKPYPFAETMFVRPQAAIAEAAIPGARRVLLALADTHLPEPEFTAPGGLADQIENAPWYKKMPEFGGWAAEKYVEYKTLAFLFKALGLSKVLAAVGNKIAAKVAGKELIAIGGKSSLLKYGGWNTFRTRVVSSLARTAPENMAFLGAWRASEAARRGEPIGPAFGYGALWGLGLSATIPLLREGLQAGISTRAFERTAVKLETKFPRLADYLKGKPEQEFIDATIESLKDEARLAGEGVPQDITFSNLSKPTQNIVKSLARRYKAAWQKALEHDAAATKYWAAGKAATQAAEKVAKAKAAVEKPIVKPEKPAKVITPKKPPAKPVAKPAEVLSKESRAIYEKERGKMARALEGEPENPQFLARRASAAFRLGEEIKQSKQDLAAAKSQFQEQFAGEWDESMAGIWDKDEYNWAKREAQKAITSAEKAEQALAKPVAKQPWEMTKAEYRADEAKRVKNATPSVKKAALFGPNIAQFHKGNVQEAVQQGKPVPAEVLAEYPDLAKPEGKVEPLKLSDKEFPVVYRKYGEIVDKTEKDKTRSMTPEERLLWQGGENWEEFSRKRGYAEQEIEDYRYWIKLNEDPRAEAARGFVDLAKPEGKVKKPVEIAKQKMRPGFVDLSPLADAGPPIRAAGEKAVKGVTRFTGLESETRKALIEYEEQLRELPKVAAKDAIEKFGKLTEGQERAIENHRENPKKYPDLPKELEPHLKTLEDGIKEYGKRLEELGYPADWPNTYVKRLEKLLQKAEKAKEPDIEKIAQLEKVLEEARDLRYLHHQYEKTPLGKRIMGRFRRSIKKKPTGVLGRKIPTYEKAEELGLKRAPLAVTYAHMRHEIERAEMANNLIVAINGNPNLSLPEDKAPDEWVRLDERIFPASVQHQAWIEEGVAKHKRQFRKYPLPIAEALQELTYARGNEAIERFYDKLNFGLKIIGFYNPIVMTKNDAVQLWRAAGVKGAIPLVLPQIDFQNISIKPPRAIQIFAEKGPEYEKLRKGGLFNNVISYTPAVKEITDQMLTHIRETSGEKAARIAKEILNPINLIKNIRKYNDMTTWNMDEIIRIACYEVVKDCPMLKGMTDFEKIEWVNDAMVNYGKIPKSTKRWIGKALFVPSYRIGNFRFFLGEFKKATKGQWRHYAPVLRTVAYKMFIRWGLPAIVASAIFWKTNEERDVRTEKGYRLVIHNPETNTDTVYALSDPLLEGAKLTQRTLRHTLALNLAPIPSLIVRASTGPRFKQSDDPFGEFFKLGTPLYRDIVNWKDKDKTVPQKILTQLAIAFVYTRRGREQDKEHIVASMAKALSVWTDWKEQTGDVRQMIYGRSYYLGAGGKFGRLIREFRMEQDIDRGEIDKKLDGLIAKGDYESAVKMMIETERYTTMDGISGRIMSWRSPLFSYWETMPNRQRVEFVTWLIQNKHYTEAEVTELQEALEKSKP